MLPYSEAGSGPAVVLIHAGICDRTMWDEHLEPLARAGYHAIAFDLPGFGDAPHRPGLQRPWIDVHLALDELSISSAAIVGNSWGGAVALRSALLMPQRFWSLTLCSAPAPGIEPSAALVGAWTREEAALAAGDLDAAVTAVVDAWTLPEAPTALRQRVGTMQRRALERQLAQPQTQEPIDPAEQPGALAALDVPALVICGGREYSDFISGAAALATALPNAELVRFPDAGHLAPLEAPELFRERLLTFLAASRAEPL